MAGAAGTSGRRRTTFTIAFVGIVLVGSWCVVTAATGSTAVHSDRRASTPRRGADTVAGSAAGSAASSTAPLPTSPLSSAPGAPASVPVAPTPEVPATTIAVIPITTSPVAPVPSPSILPRSTAPPSAPVQTAPASSASAQVAVGLIAAVNQKLGHKDAIPSTLENVALLERWMANEGGLWADNPLNTSLNAAAYPHQRSAGGGDTGIPIFSSMTVGIDATAATLLANPSYAHILRVLRSGRASCLAFATAVVRSPWASGHYDHDPSGFCSGRITPTRPNHRRHRAR